MSAISTLYFCHICDRYVDANVFQNAYKCSLCNGKFVEVILYSRTRSGDSSSHNPSNSSSANHILENIFKAMADPQIRSSANLSPYSDLINLFMQSHMRPQDRRSNTLYYRTYDDDSDYDDSASYDEILNYLFHYDQSQADGTPPASKDVVQKLVEQTIELSLVDTECTICKELFVKDEKVIALPCSHSYHKECIQKWLELHNSCPECRFELPTDDKDYEDRKSRPSISSILQTPSASTSRATPTSPEGQQSIRNRDTTNVNSNTHDVVNINNNDNDNNIDIMATISRTNDSNSSQPSDQNRPMVNSSVNITPTDTINSNSQQ